MKQRKIVAYVLMTNNRVNIRQYTKPEELFRYTLFANPYIHIEKIYEDFIYGKRKHLYQPALKELLDDCKKGDIGLILVPSCKYFAEDMVSGFKIANELISLENPVHLYFEYENIHVRNKDDIEKLIYELSYYEHHRELKRLQAIRAIRKKSNQIQRGTIISLDNYCSVAVNTEIEDENENE